MNDEQESQDAIFEYILTQYSLRQGLTKYGKLAKQAAEKELVQIHKTDAFQPLDPKRLTEDEKNGVIASLMFLTEKRYGTLKARQCADGRKQRNCMAHGINGSNFYYKCN